MNAAYAGDAMSDATTPDSRVAYLDHAATTPVYPEVIAAVAEQLARPGNASSLHGSGRAARRVVEESRETIAAAVNARPSEVVFTSGGTESDNLATKGLFWARHKEDSRRVRVLSSAVEHHAVLDSLHWLATEAGAEVELLPVDRDGRLEVDALAASVARDPDSVALVTVMLANNEVGTLQPLDAVVEIAARAQDPGPHRRGAGDGSAAARLRRLGGRRDDGHRPQDRRSARRRRPPATARGRAGRVCSMAAARSAMSGLGPSTARRSSVSR